MGGRITAFKQQAKNRHRVNVFLDGDFAFGLAKVIALTLSIGEILSDESIEDLRQRDAEEEAHRRMARWLDRRLRTEQEVRRRLDRRGEPPQVQEAVIARLTRNGLLDDRAFTQAWIENRNAFRPRSARMLRAELRQKGVAGEIISDALEPFDDSQAALGAARKGARRWRQLSYEEFKSRLGAYLARRGFRYATISPVIERVWRELSGSESEGAT